MVFYQVKLKPRLKPIAQLKVFYQVKLKPRLKPLAQLQGLVEIVKFRVLLV